MKTRVHVSLNVSDLDQSVAFYGTLFGTEPSKTRDDYANFRLETPALHLALVHKPNHPRGQTDQHFGVELFEDSILDDWRERVEAASAVLEPWMGALEKTRAEVLEKYADDFSPRHLDQELGIKTLVTVAGLPAEGLHRFGAPPAELHRRPG